MQAGFENEQTFPVRRRERVPCTVRGDCSVPERLLAAVCRGKRIFREPQITGSPVWAGFRKQTFVELMEGAKSGAMNRPGVCEAGWSAVRLWPLNTGGFGVAESVPLLLPLY